MHFQRQEERVHLHVDGLSNFMGRIVPVEYAKRAKYQPPAMRVRDGCYTKKSPFRYNEVVQAYHNERKGDFNG